MPQYRLKAILAPQRVQVHEAAKFFTVEVPHMSCCSLGKQARQHTAVPQELAKFGGRIKGQLF